MFGDPWKGSGIQAVLLMCLIDQARGRLISDSAATELRRRLFRKCVLELFEVPLEQEHHRLRIFPKRSCIYAPSKCTSQKSKSIQRVNTAERL
jgi:hypothetical protein